MVWGLGTLGSAAEGLQKIIGFAESIENRLERDNALDRIQQMYVLYFSPRFTQTVLEHAVSGQPITPRERATLRERLADTERGVMRSLEGVRELTERYGAMLSPEEHDALMTISFGKITIRRTLSELLLKSETGLTFEDRAEAAKLLDEVQKINALMDRVSRSLRSTFDNSQTVRAKGLRVSFWTVVLFFVALWAATSATAIFAVYRFGSGLFN